ncbi:hypothetical protein Tco_1542761 [Tanacetum coccineum]
MDPNNEMPDFYEYYSQLDMNHYTQYCGYLEQLEDTEEDEAESSEKRSRRYIARERELTEEKLRRDYFGDENTSPVYPKEYFRRSVLRRYMVNSKGKGSGGSKQTPTKNPDASVTKGELGSRKATEEAEKNKKANKEAERKRKAMEDKRAVEEQERKRKAEQDRKNAECSETKK